MELDTLPLNGKVYPVFLFSRHSSFFYNSTTTFFEILYFCYFSQNRNKGLLFMFLMYHFSSK